MYQRARKRGKRTTKKTAENILYFTSYSQGTLIIYYELHYSSLQSQGRRKHYQSWGRLVPGAPKQQEQVCHADEDWAQGCRVFPPPLAYHSLPTPSSQQGHLRVALFLTPSVMMLEYFWWVLCSWNFLIIQIWGNIGPLWASPENLRGISGCPRAWKEDSRLKPANLSKAGRNDLQEVV